MKKNILLLFIFAVFARSCSLDLAPENTLVDEIVYKSETTAEAALIGAYTRLNVFVAGAPNDQNNYANTGHLILLSEIGTKNMDLPESSSTYVTMETSEYTESDHEGFILNIWRYGYNAIDYANNIIAGVRRYGEFSLDKQEQFMAEAKFIRSYVYFCLLCAYGDGALTGETDTDGIVLRNDPYTGYNPDDMTGRSSVETIYNQIISDLKDACTCLPKNEYAASRRYRATKSTAQALLSRIYLYRGSFRNNAEDMQSAALYADSVLQSSSLFFSYDYTDYGRNIFPDNTYNSNNSPQNPDPTSYSDELIFFQPSRISTASYPHGLSGLYSKSSMYISQQFIDSFSEGDHRGLVLEDNQEATLCLIKKGTSVNNAGKYTTMKYSNNQGFNDVIYIRLSEVKLNKAEALARATNSIHPEALSHLNDIRRKPFATDKKPAMLTSADFNSVDEFIFEILDQRNKELAFEGHSRWDIVRTDRLLKDESVARNRMTLPVPTYEIRISYGAIQQNPGFNQ